jgi:cbb3-type cytochrome oxidase subunit 1
VTHCPISIFGAGNLIILSAAITLPLDLTSKEYAELIWPIDLAIAVVWIVFGINMFGTLSKEEKTHLCSHLVLYCYMDHSYCTSRSQ